MCAAEGKGDELGRPRRDAVTEQQLVSDRSQRPIQDRLATDEQRALFVSASLFVNSSLFVNWRWCSHWTAARRSVNRIHRCSQPGMQ